MRLAAGNSTCEYGTIACMKPRPWTVLVMLGALVGFVFALVSTADFAAHLDRQVHGIHCSFLPGVGAPDASGASGCHVTLMSPYSSVLRQSVWGGVPISLPAMSVFGFIGFFAAAAVVLGWQRDRRATGFLLAAAMLPLAASLVMAVISLVTLGTACKLCIGIYVASLLVFVGAAGLFAGALRAGRPVGGQQMSGTSVRSQGTRQPPSAEPVGGMTLAAAFVFGVCTVLLPAAVYAAAAPDHSEFVATCGTLDRPDDPHGVLIDLGEQSGTVTAVEVLDPLCPACRGFERRIAASGLDDHLNRKALLFPLDDQCNWMVDEAIHPGACTVSEAMLCAGPRAEEVLEWAFDEQQEIRTAAAADAAAAERMVAERFPDLAGCVGSANVRARLNRALRWAVANEMPVLTPQLYVDGVRLCDSDTDLGMDYTLARLLERAEAGTLVPVTEEGPGAMPAGGGER